MKFQILADDAASCNQLAENLRSALKKLQLESTVEMEVAPGQAESPVISENGRVISSGRILSPEEISELLCSLYRSEIEDLQKAALQRQRRAHLMKGIFLTVAILCCVFAIGSEIRSRRAAAAKDAARPVVLHFTSPVKMLYFYRRPRPKNDVDQEVFLRRLVYAVYPEEIKRNLFSIEPLDADRPENAAKLRNYGIQTVPAVILQKKENFRQLILKDDENPAEQLIQTVELLK